MNSLCKANRYVFLITLSVCFIGFIIFVFRMEPPCFWNSQEGCLPANAFGDFIAGMAATLAFILLAVSNYQTRKSLEYQAQSLRLQEEALREQITEIQNSVMEMKESNKISEASAKHLEREVFFKHAEILMEKMRSNLLYIFQNCEMETTKRNGKNIQMVYECVSDYSNFELFLLSDKIHHFIRKKKVGSASYDLSAIKSFFISYQELRSISDQSGLQEIFAHNSLKEIKDFLEEAYEGVRDSVPFDHPYYDKVIKKIEEWKPSLD